MPVYDDRDEPVNQGDIFDEVPFVVAPEGRASMGMVISHDCDLDKYLRPRNPLAPEVADAWRISMAVVHPVDELTGGRDGDVRADRMPRYLYLPAEDDLPELCVDLWTEQPVLMADVIELRHVASLSPESRERLWWKIIRLRLGEHYRAILEGKTPPDAA